MACAQLADYLAANPGIPVPRYGTTILLHLDDAEDGGRAAGRRPRRSDWAALCRTSTG